MDTSAEVDTRAPKTSSSSPSTPSSPSSPWERETEEVSPHSEQVNVSLRINSTVKDRLRAAQQKKKKNAEENKSKVGAALGKFLDDDTNSRPNSRDARSVSGASTASRKSRRRSSKKLSGWKAFDASASRDSNLSLSKSEHRGKLHRSRSSADGSLSPTKSPGKHQSTRPRLQKSASAKLPSSSRRQSISRSKSPDDNKGRLGAMLSSNARKSPRSRRRSGERSVVSVPADQRLSSSRHGSKSSSNNGRQNKKSRSSDNAGKLGSMLGREEKKKKSSSRGRRSGERSVASMPADYRRRAESAPSDRHRSRKDQERSTSRNPSSRDRERSRSRSKSAMRRPSMRRQASESVISQRAAEDTLHSSVGSFGKLSISNTTRPQHDRAVGKKVASKASANIGKQEGGVESLRSPTRRQNSIRNGVAQSIHGAHSHSRRGMSVDASQRRSSMTQGSKEVEAKHKRVRSSGALNPGIDNTTETSFLLEELGIRGSQSETPKMAPDSSAVAHSNMSRSERITGATGKKKAKKSVPTEVEDLRKADGVDRSLRMVDLGDGVSLTTDTTRPDPSDKIRAPLGGSNRRDGLRRHRSMDPVRHSNPYAEPPEDSTMRANSMMLQREKVRRLGKSKSLMDLVEYKDEDIHSTSYFASNHVLINRERMKRGLRPLVRNSKMDELAREHSKKMAECSGCTPIQTTFVGNVMRGESIRSIHKITMANKQGRERYNLLNPYFQEFGIGTAQGKDGQLYLCQLFSERIELTLMDTENQPSVAPY